MAGPSLPDPRQFFNRHLSWLQFNRRVLEEALDANNPLLERVKFLAITASNLDEFVEVRLAGLLQQVEQGRGEVGPDGLMPAMWCWSSLRRRCRNSCKTNMPAGARNSFLRSPQESIRVRSVSELKPPARRMVDRFYSERVEPLLTPVTVDPAHPFPRVLNKALCLAFLAASPPQSPRKFTWAW